MKSKFNYFGYFYELFLGEYTVKCRSVLEIVRVGKELNKESGVEAVVIMMNPGGSEPKGKDRSYTVERIDVENFVMDFDYGKLVQTIPDVTQSRITTIMDYKGWNHVRILNLSDIREKKNGNLSKKIREFEQRNLSMVHSIFSPQRKEERVKFLGEGVPVILAWGTLPCTKKYIERCLLELKENGMNWVGIPSSQGEWYYHHPLTTQLSWCSEMKKIL
ncbi:DUF1643 domain-containing protein [Bacillus cereus]|uniref:DUF1643 domain-containing protein n=1 Tax=Bacillus cereus TaxID=1396 RepID=UPI00235ECEE3|nr:DUF1643 domain-containing protein [Bacillus cereus]MDD0822346.1 DUF1643 domain-containing protein [Bacillus cereus]